MPEKTRSPQPIDILLDAIDHAGTPACVGIDPVIEKVPAPLRDPAGAGPTLQRFTECVLRAVRPAVAVAKLQSACYERHGSPGFAALERSIALARDLGFVVILDAKRGDIGISAEHYAAAARSMGAHWITISPYMGMECVEPFLAAGLGVFVLVRTSNRGSDEVQSQPLQSGLNVSEYVAQRVADLGTRFMSARGLSSVAAVVGATKSSDARRLRQVMPNQLFLIPGFGAQGGTVEDVRAMTRPAGDGVLVTASRSVIYPSNEGDPGQSIHRAASDFASQLRDL